MKYGHANAEWLRQIQDEQASEDSGWKLICEDINDPNVRDPFIGNGYIGQIVPPEGDGYWQRPETWRAFRFRGSNSGCKIHGHWNHQELMDGARWSALRFCDGIAWFGRPSGTVENYKQTLDMKSSTVITEMDWSSHGNSEGVSRKTHVKYKTWLSRTDRNLGVVELEVTPDYDGLIIIQDELNCSGKDELHNVLSEEKETLFYSYEQGPKRRKVALASKLLFDKELFIREWPKFEKYPTNRYDLKAEKGQTITITKVVGIFTDQDGGDLYTKALSFVHQKSKKIEQEYSKHQAAWEKLWQSDIQVPHAGAQQVIRACLYQLYAQLRSEVVWSLGPNGINASSQFGGRAFWDADLWMAPPMLMLQPELARCILAYRHKTLKGAQFNAKSEGYQGARYAWESAESGVEICYGVTAKQLHQIGDIALTQWWYRQIAGNEAFERDGGREVILECAKFFASRVVFNDKKDRYEIRDICCADEHANQAHNNTYTNYTAIHTLKLASELLKETDDEVPEKWNDIIQKIYLPYDEKLGTWNEHEHYQGEIIKQADTTLLVYPYAMPMSDKQKRAMADYYPTRYPRNKIMMAAAIDGIVHAELDRPQKVWECFLDLLPHFRRPFLQASESPSNECLSFATGLGGLLQLVLNGMLGLRITEKGLSFNPCLPKELPSIQVKGMHCRGVSFDVKVEDSKITVSNLSAAQEFEIEVSRGLDLRIED